jgi:hypothetical protein
MRVEKEAEDDALRGVVVGHGASMYEHVFDD